MIPLKYKNWVLKKALSHKINQEPSEITGAEKSIRIKKIDKEKILIDVTSLRFTSIVYLVLCVLGGLLFLDLPRVDILAVILISVSFGLAVFSLLWFIFFKKKYVVFDRDRGIVSIPGPFWYKNVEIPFREVIATVRLENRLYGLAKVLNLYRPDGYRADVGINTHDLEELKRDWAFYCWYMDKSRPLPPSPVFEQY